MRYLLLAALALATFLPQQSSASSLAGSFYGNTTNGPVLGADSIHYNIIEMFIPGPQPGYSYGLTFATDFSGGLRVFTAFPDITD
ncbi:hypothetical protein [Bryobacter aggregatus]|uniref:hypothetical protein n=1 Tax=Bryobacter aggregatus TaxID=360054 RepID=UPI0004E105A7|nr:hypothetical protein [Bryobacter aggregatus]